MPRRPSVNASGKFNTVVNPITVSYAYNAPADDAFFVAPFACRVIGIMHRVTVAGTDASAVTAVVKKAASGTAVASGTALMQSTIDLKGTASTNQTVSLTTTAADLDIAAGTCIGLDVTGTTTAATGVITVLLIPT